MVWPDNFFYYQYSIRVVLAKCIKLYVLILILTQLLSFSVLFLQLIIVTLIMRTICIIIIIITLIIPSNAEDTCIQSQSQNDAACCELSNKCIFPFKHFDKKYESCTNQNTKYESVCYVKENHCFPSLAEDYNYYGGSESKKCKDASEIHELKNTHINGHYCKIQPDQRSDEETWSKCSANCLDNGNPIKDETGVCTTEPQKCKFPFKVGYDMNYFRCVSAIEY